MKCWDGTGISGSSDREFAGGVLNRVEGNSQPEENRRRAGGNGVREGQRNCRVWERERSRDSRMKGRDGEIRSGSEGG